MVYLACIITSKESSELGATLEDIFDLAAALPTHSHTVKWRDDFLHLHPIETKEHLLEVLEEYPHIFEVSSKDGSTYIRVSDEARRIPTMWDSTLLTIIDAKSGEIYDVSRTYTFHGYVATTKGQFFEVNIIRGPFTGRDVYFLARNAKMQSHWITGYFPPGTEISVTAHFVINHKSPFRAIKVERIADIREETVDARFGVSTKNIVRKMEDALEYWRSTGALQDCIAEHDSVGPLLRNPLLTSSEEGRLKSIEDRLVEKFL